MRISFLLSGIILSTFVIQTYAQTIDLNQKQREQIESVISEQLRDPESARFRWDADTFEISPTNGYGEVCIAFNARNGFGGYVGYKLAWINFFKKEDEIAQIRVVRMGDKSTVESCENIKENILKAKHHDPRITDDQARAGCTILDSHLFCSSPGTGMCWEKGHNPWKGEAPARSINVGNGPEKDRESSERCG